MESELDGVDQKGGENSSTPAPRQSNLSAREYDDWEFCRVRVNSSIAEYLRSLGKGDISAGIEIAVQFHRERVQKEG